MSFKYKAFISYSHADEKWARWLQRKLEHYRVPRRLATARAGGEALPRRLHPVFRDQDELASSTDLGKAVEAALAQSEFLVVVCSPASARSRWVNEEITRFKLKRSKDRILCLVIDGDLSSDSERCAFPPALLVNEDGSAAPEPLAADVRKAADGPRAALQKIIAGILQVGIDDLRQREVQRQVRRWTVLAALSASVAVVTIGLAIVAMAAREEAQIRRGQAENLIGFMLGDLRGKLEPIGKLDVLDAVGDEAMKYYAELGDQATPAETLGRAIALRQIGEVRFAQGQFDTALQAFEESRLQAERLHRLDPANNDHLFELGQAEFWVGYVQYERDQLDAAGRSMARYLEHSQELSHRQPDNPDYTMELAYAFSNLGTIERERGSMAPALEYFTGAVEINEELLAASPDDTYLRFDLGEGYSWMGSIRLDLGQLQASEAAFRRSLEIWQELAALGENARHVEKAADGQTLLARALLQSGQSDEALGLYQLSHDAFGKLLRTDPENVRYQRGFYKSHFYLANVLRFQGWNDVALDHLATAREGFAELVRKEPGDTAMAEFLAQSDRLTAEARLEHDVEAALESARRAHAWVESLGAQARLAQSTARDAAQIGETRGRVLARAGRMNDASEAWSATLEEWFSGDVSELSRRAVQARLLWNLGRRDEAAVLVKELQAAGYQHPEFHLLINQ